MSNRSLERAYHPALSYSLPLQGPIQGHFLRIYFDLSGPYGSGPGLYEGETLQEKHTFLKCIVINKKHCSSYKYSFFL